MARITDDIPNLINGISQQPPTLRLSTQAEAQVNFLSSVVDGLKKRPPTNHLAKLTSGSFQDAHLHTINRDINERYQVVITDGDLAVYDLEGTAKTVAFPDGKGYLDVNDAKADFRAVTVADYTFIVNQTVTCAMSSDTVTERDKEALITVRQGNYGHSYSISIDGNQRATYQTPDGSASSHTSDITTDNIAAELLSDLVSWGGANFTFTRYGNAIHISNDTDDFAVSVEDGLSGAALKVAKDKLQDFSDLPIEGPDGFHIEIVGDASNAWDNYYVKYEKTAAGDSAGVWVETVAQGITYKFDTATMPHILVRESDGTFTFQEATWADREVGDETSAETSSFIGNKINDVLFHKNRLGFLTEESIVLSKAGDFFNHWPTTVTALLDGDRIDIAVTTKDVAILRHAIDFDDTLLLFSDQRQFTMQGGDLLTPTSANIVPSTVFQADLLTTPVAAGRNVYFITNKGSYDGLREYYLATENNAEDAAEVSGHVPKYLPSGTFKLISATNEDILFALTKGEENSIFVYKYYWNGADKLQSSWSKWTFAEGDKILNGSVIDSLLYLVIERSDGVYLESISIEAGATDTDSALLYHLDRKVYETACTVSYDSETDKTTFTLPYEEEGMMLGIVRAGNTAYNWPEGYYPPITRPTDNTIVMSGDRTSLKVAFGRKYLSTYTFSSFYVRTGNAGSEKAITSGRTQVLALLLNYSETGYFKVKVTPLYRDTYTYTFTGHVVGSPKNKFGSVPLETGQFRVPVYSKNTQTSITIETDSPLPASFTSASWIGNFVENARRI